MPDNKNDPSTMVEEDYIYAIYELDEIFKTFLILIKYSKNNKKPVEYYNRAIDIVLKGIDLEEEFNDNKIIFSDEYMDLRDNQLIDKMVFIHDNRVHFANSLF